MKASVQVSGIYIGCSLGKILRAFARKLKVSSVSYIYSWFINLAVEEKDTVPFHPELYNL